MTKTISEKNQSWGLNKHQGKYQDNTLIIYARNDTIYNLCENKITPRYIANFTQNRLPDDLLKESGMKITMAAYTKGYTTGLNKIYNSKNFIIGGFTEGKKAFNFFYNKLNDSTLVSSSFEIGDLGNLPVSINMESTDNNEIVMTYEAMLFKQIWGNIITSNSFKNSKNRKKIEAIANTLKDDDNPVMIKLKIR